MPKDMKVMVIISNIKSFGFNAKQLDFIKIFMI